MLDVPLISSVESSIDPTHISNSHSIADLIQTTSNLSLEFGEEVDNSDNWDDSDGLEFGDLDSDFSDDTEVVGTVSSIATLAIRPCM